MSKPLRINDDWAAAKCVNLRFVCLYRSAVSCVRVQRGLVPVFFLQMYPRPCLKEYDYKKTNSKLPDFLRKLSLLPQCQWDRRSFNFHAANQPTLCANQSTLCANQSTLCHIPEKQKSYVTYCFPLLLNEGQRRWCQKFWPISENMTSSLT